MRLPFAVRTGMSWGWVPRQARHFQMQEGILNHIEYLPFHSPPSPPQPYYCICTSTTASDFCHVSHSNIFSPSASMTGRLPRHGSCGITLAMCRRPAPQFRRAKTIRRANKIHDALPPRFCRCRCRFRPLPTGKGPAHVLNTASGTALAAPTAAGAFHIAEAGSWWPSLSILVHPTRQMCRCLVHSPPSAGFS